MYPILREQFVPGPYEHVFDGEDDDSGHPEQQGQPLVELIETVLGDHVPFMSVLERAVQEEDPADIADGDEPYFFDGGLFVERPVYLDEHYERWARVQNELRHARRFFSGAAKDLFDVLFEDVERLKGRLDDGEVRDVVYDLPTASVLYRARRCDDQLTLKRMVGNPAGELGPPPAHAARAGRMNAEGISVFYGALDRDTCIAELRPALGAQVAVGAFQTSRPIRLLDFRLLESAYWGVEPLSYFQSDFESQVEKREFTRRLHRLIRAPVLPGREADYLITQAMAEYLANIRTRAFDGVVFESAQHATGANIVLFPTTFENRGTAQPLLSIHNSEGLTLHQVNGIEYEFSDLAYVEQSNGDMVSYDPAAGPDDE